MDFLALFWSYKSTMHNFGSHEAYKNEFSSKVREDRRNIYESFDFFEFLFAKISVFIVMQIATFQHYKWDNERRAKR